VLTPAAVAPAEVGRGSVTILADYELLVSVGKRSFGYTPIRLLMPAGRHVILLTTAVGLPMRVPIDVRSGAHTTLRVSPYADGLAIRAQ